MKNGKSIGVPFNDDHLVAGKSGSTDMGNVSKIKPSIHPNFRIKTEGANHTVKFTEATCLADNQLPTLNSAKSMAMTAIDVVSYPDIMEKVRQDFAK